MMNIEPGISNVEGLVRVPFLHRTTFLFRHSMVNPIITFFVSTPISFSASSEKIRENDETPGQVCFVTAPVYDSFPSRRLSLEKGLVPFVPPEAEKEIGTRQSLAPARGVGQAPGGFLAWLHSPGQATGRVTVNTVPWPVPALSAFTWPPCSSTIRFTMASPSPVELSPPVGVADRR